MYTAKGGLLRGWSVNQDRTVKPVTRGCNEWIYSINDCDELVNINTYSFKTETAKVTNYFVDFYWIKNEKFRFGVD